MFVAMFSNAMVGNDEGFGPQVTTHSSGVRSVSAGHFPGERSKGPFSI